MLPRVLRRMFTVGAVALVLAPRAAGAQQSAIPTPESVFGFRVGADFRLVDYDQSIAYSAGSPRPATASSSWTWGSRPPAIPGRSPSSRRRRIWRSSTTTGTSRRSSPTPKD